MSANLGKLLVLAGLVFIILGLIFIPTFAIGEDTSNIVRVAVVTDADQIRLSISSPYQILTLNTNEQLYQGRRLWWSRVIPSETGIKIGKLDFKIYGVRIQPSRSPTIILNGRRFRGAIDIIRQPNKKLLVINYLDVEEYVCGVLYHEIAPWWPLEALKAQAIVARTFALYQTKANAHKDYDLVSTTYSQVYGGRTSERGRTTKAVKLTEAKVLTYQNKLFPSFYHATCAGHTENASRLWNIDLVALRGRECQFCQGSPHFHWQAKISLTDIEQALESAGFKVGLIDSIKIIDRDISGRITDLEIISTRGKIKVSANKFRLAVGPNTIRSTNFDLEIKRTRLPLQKETQGIVYFQGSGWGHGVGMCQWGAFFMSKKKFNAQQILDYYYPESKIKSIEEIKDAKGEFKTF